MKDILYKDYKRLIKTGKKIYTGYYLIYFTPWKKRVIKTAAKKCIGNAVKRNYEKRHLRSIFDKIVRFDKVFFLIIAVKCNTMNYEHKKRHLLNYLKKNGNECEI